jgi:hypothetical protein
MEQLSGMSEEEQRRILEIARSLSAKSGDGVNGSSLLRFAGTISADDARRMSVAIEEGCERIDPNEW